jgi:hypothetical protein
MRCFRFGITITISLAMFMICANFPLHSVRVFVLHFRVRVT